jgi:hypothetical protein
MKRDFWTIFIIFMPVRNVALPLNSGKFDYSNPSMSSPSPPGPPKVHSPRSRSLVWANVKYVALDKSLHLLIVATCDVTARSCPTTRCAAILTRDLWPIVASTAWTFSVASHTSEIMRQFKSAVSSALDTYLGIFTGDTNINMSFTEINNMSA